MGFDLTTSSVAFATEASRERKLMGEEVPGDDSPNSPGTSEAANKPRAKPWSDANPSAVATWATLLHLRQHREWSFSNSKDFPLSRLAIFSALSSNSEHRKARAFMLATLLHENFVQRYGAVNEEGVEFSDAVIEASKELSNSKATLSSLAEVVDRLYSFVGEV